MTAPTLTEALAAHGYAHRKGGPGYSHEILKDGVVVFTGTAHETWARACHNLLDNPNSETKRTP